MTPRCSNCRKPFVFWRDHWHCTAPSCGVFRCKKATRTAAVRVTSLENEVLADVVAGRDPWRGRFSSVGSRTVSQALQRLRRKGLIEPEYGSMVITPAGREWLARHDKPAAKPKETL